MARVTVDRDLETPEFRDKYGLDLVRNLCKLGVKQREAVAFVDGLPAGEINLLELPEARIPNCLIWVNERLNTARDIAVFSALHWGSYSGRKALPQYLRLRGITLSDLAGKIGVKKSILAVWLASIAHGVKPGYVQVIANYLGLELGSVVALLEIPASRKDASDANESQL